ncbi:hypothetical protein VTJ83DRAFT_4264 [Remersonia thermophila]|uniref:Rab-GAP TBC domain-containing protein n=1 Tax=Remersonia thermophila TaxID=72144 RepID=A0ABR4DBM0_9PEZI
MARPTTSDNDATPRASASPVATKGASSHDSLVTVRLSGGPALQIDTEVPPSTMLARTSSIPEPIPNGSTTIETAEDNDGDDDEDDSESEIFEPETRRRPNLLQELGGGAGIRGSHGRKRGDSCSSSDSENIDWDALQEKEDLEAKQHASRNAGRGGGGGGDALEPDAASLLAKLDRENARIAVAATNPRAAAFQSSATKAPRPPSMAQLRKMVSGPMPPALRYSTLPPTPMTELDFYLALVKDPKQTAARLPTLLSNKVRKGIPPPLRGVVWQSMAGARDSALEELYERLSGESSPYEGVISKDLGRSFPGVEMFRDPEGDGQRMLGRVLKCFSLYDAKIGYCQGLAFLVGPLLMHMGDKQAFCVLVRLMESYNLRQCFTPDLSGLHLRIYQFRELLRQHLPTLSAHLDQLGVDHAYVSQWFLSFYAVTCPLPMLFRIYDVIFAEGASETIMRVALSLMRKNQVRILACTEFEDVMHLLLSRGVWDCYGHNADDFVNDFVALADVVTRERLAALEQGYKEQQEAAKISEADGANHRTDAPQASGADVTTVASRFLGRLWASSSASTPKFTTFAAAAAAAAQASASASASASTSPPTAAAAALNPTSSIVGRPLSMLRRSTSKQSLSSMEAASSSTASSAASVFSSASSTDTATTISRDSGPDEPLPPTSGPAKTSAAAAAAAAVGGASAKDGSKHLHTQIEDLLTALSELQRNHATLTSQLQREKEEREEDRRAVHALLGGLRSGDASNEEDASSSSSPTTITLAPGTNLPGLIAAVKDRFGDQADNDASPAMAETKQELRDELARVRNQLTEECARSTELRRRIRDMESEASSLRDQLRESHAHVRNIHQEKQRLERQIHGMRLRASDSAAADRGGGGGGAGGGAGGGGGASDWFPRALVSGALGGAASSSSSSATTATGAGMANAKTSGLRELKLGRSRSTPYHAAPASSSSSSGLGAHLAPTKRSSTLPMTRKDSTASTLSTHSQHSLVEQQLKQPVEPTSEHDALLLDLVQAKTAEAVARQELEECRQKLEQLRKAVGLGPGQDLPPPSSSASSSSPFSSSVSSASGLSASPPSISGAAVVMGGMFGRLTGADPSSAGTRSVSGPAPASGAGAATSSSSGGGGGFWGWRR